MLEQYIMFFDDGCNDELERVSLFLGGEFLLLFSSQSRQVHFCGGIKKKQALLNL